MYFKRRTMDFGWECWLQVLLGGLMGTYGIVWSHRVVRHLLGRIAPHMQPLVKCKAVKTKRRYADHFFLFFWAWNWYGAFAQYYWLCEGWLHSCVVALVPRDAHETDRDKLRGHHASIFMIKGESGSLALQAEYVRTRGRWRMGCLCAQHLTAIAVFIFSPKISTRGFKIMWAAGSAIPLLFEHIPEGNQAGLLLSVRTTQRQVSLVLRE